jgi:hypothetical protein
MSSDAAGLQASLAALTEATESLRVADAALLTWRKVASALSPIIGQRGVAALFQRSQHLTRSGHACLEPVAAALAGPDADSAPADPFALLQAVLSPLASAEAGAAHVALLRTFCDLLTHLIGAALTERLLRPVWPAPDGVAPDPDRQTPSP